MAAYIFDLDGTILDSMGVWHDIDIEFLRKRGFDVPDDYVSTIAAMTLSEAAHYTIERFRLKENATEIVTEWLKMAAYAYSRTVKLKPYAKEYLLALHKSGVKLAVATSAKPELYEPALFNHGIYNLFHVICNADEVGSGKSKPDIFIHAARKLNISTSECIVFDDLLVAVKNAKSVGMKVYGVLDKASEDDWEQIKAIADGTIVNFMDAPLPMLEEGILHGQ